MITLLGGASGVADDRALRRTGAVVAAAAGLIAGTVLLLWVVEPSSVDRFSPGTATMKANVAAACIALAASLAFRHTVMVAALSVLPAAAGLASLAEYGFSVDLGIDELLVQDVISGPAEIAGRMAPATAICLVFLAAARWAAHRGARRLAEGLLLPPLGLGALALLGHLLQVEQLYTFVAYSSVALPTAVSVLLLASSIALSVPDGTVGWLAADRGAGATLARHMVPVALVAMPVLSVLPIIGLDTELFGERFGVALMVAAAAILVIGVAGVAARRLDRIDRERLAAQAGLRELNDQLRERRDLEWRRAEELSRNLEEERARFRRAVGAVDDLIWTVQVLPDGQIRTEFSSGDASGLFGGSGAGRQRRTRVLPELVHPEDRQLLEQFDDKIRAGVAAEAELRVVGYDDVVRWVWVRGTPRRERSGLFFDGISTNVTDRHHLAERREHLLTLEQEQVRKLKQLNQLREELLAVTGHELRTPLAVVLGYAELLLQDTDLTAVQRRHLEVVGNRARQMALLVEDIFDLAEFSAGLASIEVRPVALHEVVREAVEKHRGAAKAAALTVDLALAPVTVAADQARLRQVLDNLLSNAVKYSLPGGHVSVTATTDGSTATIAVSDGGIGIPEAEVDHVFDRMYRASIAKERDVNGTGLGLSVAKALVEAHAGTISVTNRPEGGARFTVAIPVRRTAPANGAAAAAPTSVRI